MAHRYLESICYVWRLWHWVTNWPAVACIPNECADEHWWVGPTDQPTNWRTDRWTVACADVHWWVGPTDRLTCQTGSAEVWQSTGTARGGGWHRYRFNLGGAAPENASVRVWGFYRIYTSSMFDTYHWCTPSIDGLSWTLWYWSCIKIALNIETPRSIPNECTCFTPLHRLVSAYVSLCTFHLNLGAGSQKVRREQTLVHRLGAAHTRSGTSVSLLEEILIMSPRKNTYFY